MKMTKAQLEQENANLKRENTDLKKNKGNRVPQPDDAAIFPKRDGAKDKAPDFSGYFIDTDGRKKLLGFWWNRNKSALNGKVTDPVALEVKRTEDRDPSFIPSIDAK
jgi:hypothetical protein